MHMTEDVLPLPAASPSPAAASGRRKSTSRSEAGPGTATSIIGRIRALFSSEQTPPPPPPPPRVPSPQPRSLPPLPSRPKPPPSESASAFAAGIGGLDLPSGLASTGAAGPAATARRISCAIDELWLACTEERGALDLPRYKRFHCCMTRALRRTFDEADASARAENDYGADCVGGDAVPRHRFVAMMRTLASRWSGGDEERGAAFLDQLLEQMTEPSQSSPAARRLRDPSRVALGSCIPPPSSSSSSRPRPTSSRSAPPPGHRSPSPEDDDDEEEEEERRRRALPQSRRRSNSESDGSPPRLQPLALARAQRRSSTSDAGPMSPWGAAVPPAVGASREGGGAGGSSAASLRRYALLNRYRIERRMSITDE